MKMKFAMSAAALAAAFVAPSAGGAAKAKDVPPLLATDAGKVVSNAQKGADEIVLCDQLKQTIDIYSAEGLNVWRWCPKDDPDIAGGDKGGFMNNVAESKPFAGGSKIGMVSCGGRWAVIDRAAHKVTAWGRCNGWAHSIEMVGPDVVAVVSTGGTGGNSLFLFDITGDMAMNPYRQKKFLWFT